MNDIQSCTTRISSLPLSDQPSALSNYDDQWKWDYLAWPWRQCIVLSSHAPKKNLSFRSLFKKKSMGSFKGCNWQRPSFYQSFKLDSKPFLIVLQRTRLLVSRIKISVTTIKAFTNERNTLKKKKPQPAGMLYRTLTLI
jgi:hypothetical protein